MRLLYCTVGCGPRFTGTEATRFIINDSRFDSVTWELDTSSVVPGDTLEFFNGQYLSVVPANASKLVEFVDEESGSYQGFFFIDENNQAAGVAVIANLQ